MAKKENDRVIFTKEMKKTHTLLAPSMAPIHFGIVQNVFRSCGYKMEFLTNSGPQIAQEGLKYVHNDTCYPALLVIGQMIDALNSGKYDINKVALMITQTGGGCRASNYIHLLRKALKKAGYGLVPVVSLNMSGLESNPGFKLTLPMLRKIIAGIVYGDELMLLSNQVRPYEAVAGETDRLLSGWINKISTTFDANKGFTVRHMLPTLEAIAADFAKIPVNRTPKIRVGVVGEIYVKYASLGNNNLEDFLRQQGCEYMVPGIMGFALFKVDNRLEDCKLYGGNPAKYALCSILMQYLTKMETGLIEAVKKYPQFVCPSPYQHIKSLVKGVVGYGSKMGEGWLLTAEMMELSETGYPNIVCTQPFGCLPNHINGKGMIRKIKTVDPRANIVPIDYDPSATRVNQENRIKLMLAVAKEELDAQPFASAVTVPPVIIDDVVTV
ncbi:MAG: 2-hydroxyacyl-CoA dehydratase [Oscillospiraceae bacterium]|nr:2-hydroxyacyl-CoA dehydratase [Oscillospiraceae bacterium]